jgi:signal transduction histidine kinase
VRRRWLGLRPRFVVAISALIALVLAGNAYVLVIEAEQELREGIEARAAAFGTLAVAPLASAYDAYAASGRPKLREVARRLLALNPEVTSLVLYDVLGAVRFDSRELAAPGALPVVRPPAAGELLELVRGLEVVSGPALDAEGRRRFRVVVPHVEEWGRRRYTLVLEAGYGNLRGATRAVARRNGAWAAIALGLGVLLASGLARRSLQPLEELRQGAEALAAGRLDQRIALATRDEFEQLAGAFNGMAERLSATIADLEGSNRALQAANQELTELDRLRTHLLANVSHELRTPLTAVQGYAEALGAGLLGPLAAGQEEALEVMRRNLGRLLVMIEELITTARLDEHTLTLVPRPFDLRALIEEEVATLRAARPGSCELRVEAEALPPVLGDRMRLGQVLVNLLDNALKFTPAEGSVTVRLRRRGGAAEVEVADTGIGLDVEQRARIFDRFYQADPSTRRRYGGLGLGLAIVRELLAAHGAPIEVESELGAGTRFRFALPFAASATDGSAPGPRVLAIGGEPAFLDDLARALAARGLALDRASTRVTARERAAASRPAAVVMTRLLPDGDAFDLLGPAGPFPGIPVAARVRAGEAGLARHRGAAAALPLEAGVSEVAEATARLAAAEALESSGEDPGGEMNGRRAVRDPGAGPGPGAGGESA